jgi:hypothetical protein
MISVPSGKHIGERLDDNLKDESGHFIRCRACGAWVDCRDLNAILEHAGPLPHPARTQAYDR